MPRSAALHPPALHPPALHPPALHPDALHPAVLDPPALADALDRVRELSLRLWAVREAHPVCRGLLGRLRCRTCGGAWPCPTVRATAVYDDGGALRSSS